MAQPALRLPSEVWNHVFGYLSATDKFSVRASCKYFKKLVDHRSLWKDWSVVLGFPKGSYNSQFWATLRRRKVTSVVVRGTKVQDWKRLALSLSTLTTVVVDQRSQASLNCLKDFPHLERLAIRSCPTSVLINGFTVYQPQQLTHLSICDIRLPFMSLTCLISAVSKFPNLTSLACHEMSVVDETISMIYAILSCLPKLKHLSMACLQPMYSYSQSPLGDAGALPKGVLSSLELVNCLDYSLPENAMTLMPGLKSLAIFFSGTVQLLPETRPDGHLTTWLSDLPQLSTLVIVKSPPVKRYVTAIPATVTSLTLCAAGLSSEDMAAVSVQVPNLLHLHVDPWPSHFAAHAAQIPQHFPKLKSLKLRQEHVLERDFLNLHQLKDLEYLEILDSRPHLSELTCKLQALTNYRLQVTTSPRRRDVLTCPCVCQMY